MPLRAVRSKSKDLMRAGGEATAGSQAHTHIQMIRLQSRFTHHHAFRPTRNRVDFPSLLLAYRLTRFAFTHFSCTVIVHSHSWASEQHGSKGIIQFWFRLRMAVPVCRRTHFPLRCLLLQPCCTFAMKSPMREKIVLTGVMNSFQHKHTGTLATLLKSVRLCPLEGREGQSNPVPKI